MGLEMGAAQAGGKNRCSVQEACTASAVEEDDGGGMHLLLVPNV